MTTDHMNSSVHTPRNDGMKGPLTNYRYFLVGILMVVMVIALSARPPALNSSSGPLPVTKPLTQAVLQAATGPLYVDPDNPRYFTDGNGKAILLTGSHTWANFQEAGESNPPPVFDYEAYLDFLQQNRLNFFRLWSWEQTMGIADSEGEFRVTPSAYRRTGPGGAYDGKPKFDLTQFYQPYFDRLRERVIQAGERGIYVSIMLFNGWSIDDKGIGPGNAWPGHPYNLFNNINGVDGDLNQNGMGEEIHTLQSPAITSLQEAYVRKVIDTVNDLDNVLFEISNESPSNSQDWQYHMIDYIKSYEADKPKQHPVGMTVEYPGGDNGELFASSAEWISPNEVGGYKDNPPVANGSKVILVDTDHLWGIGGNRQWVWKSFMRGLNPIYMDCYSLVYCPDIDPNDPVRISLIENMGYMLAYAKRIDLEKMVPHGELASTGYALANPSEIDGEFLVYLPSGSEVTVNLTSMPGSLYVEWFNPETGAITIPDRIIGGFPVTLYPPFNGEAVLYIKNLKLTSNFRLYLPHILYLRH
jgi:hypothetical protein